MITSVGSHEIQALNAWQKNYENTLLTQKQNANSQNVLGGAALLLNTPKMLEGAGSLWKTGKAGYEWLNKGSD